MYQVFDVTNPRVKFSAPSVVDALTLFARALRLGSVRWVVNPVDQDFDADALYNTATGFPNGSLKSVFVRIEELQPLELEPELELDLDLDWPFQIERRLLSPYCCLYAHILYFAGVQVGGACAFPTGGNPGPHRPGGFPHWGKGAACPPPYPAIAFKAQVF